MRHTELTAGMRFAVKDVNFGHHGDAKHLFAWTSSGETVHESLLTHLDWGRRKTVLIRN